MRPTAFQAAMAQASRAIVRAGVMVDIVDVGGGFPSVYPGMVPPDMADYLDSIERGFAEMMVHEDTELWCEPGRALVAEASSILTKVELKKGDALYLNDGSYGSLFDAAHTKWPFPVKLFRNDGGTAIEVEGPLKPFRFYGPTCDSLDHMPGPFWLPEDIREGDYVEIGMLGAYGVAMNTNFNGFGDAETVEVKDAPMASMFGLAVRSIRLPREAQEEEPNKVVRLSRPKGAAGKKRREKGLARSGNARVRRGMIQLAWRFLMFQKDSALAHWFYARTKNAPQTRKTMIVALARKLLIALWRLAREGAIPEGIVLRPAL